MGCVQLTDKLQGVCDAWIMTKTRPRSSHDCAVSKDRVRAITQMVEDDKYCIDILTPDFGVEFRR